MLTLNARYFWQVEEGIDVPLEQDCRVARDHEMLGRKALRRAVFVRSSLGANPVVGSVHGLSRACRIAHGWRAGSVIASLGGRQCRSRVASLPRLARRLSGRFMSQAAAARLRAVGAWAHARLGLEDEKLTMQSSRRRNRLLAQTWQRSRRGLLRR